LSIENLALIEIVRAHLFEDKRLADQCIDVTCSGGYIQLLGIVDSKDLKDLAVTLAQGIVGVRHVEDMISVRKKVTIAVA
jgi:osmotically-inducible protein OsmY